MALTLQRKLELAGDLSKVQPLLQRLHIVEKPKKRHRIRTMVLVGGSIAAGTVLAVVVCRRRGCCNGSVAANGADTEARSPGQNAPDAESDSDSPAPDADGPQGNDA